jgi:DnaJ domain
MEEPSINECFRLLKLRRGVDFSEVKQAYRKNLYKCHPDRFQERPELLPIAERKTKRLIEVYGILERWYEGNGGTDSSPPGQEPTAGPDGSEEKSAQEQAASLFHQRLKAGLAAAAVVAVLAGLVWNFFIRPDEKDRTQPEIAAMAPTAPETGAPGASSGPKPETISAAAPIPESKIADLEAMIAERDRIQAAWVASYMRDREAEKSAREKDLVDALAQATRFERDNAVEIKDALETTAAQVALAHKDAAAAKAAFVAQEQENIEAARRTYDDWLLARGKEAVLLVQSIRKRENSDIGAFSDTEDPREIFHFWTPGEAGAPEINIAAKTGVTVGQPDPRFFPHFRSNIFLYDPEGKVLEGMMTSIVERHDALLKGIADNNAATDAALANWDASHPAVGVQLDPLLQQAMDGRKTAMDRVEQARVGLESADLGVSLLKAKTAFGRTPEGLTREARISAARESLALAQGKH